MKFRPVLCSLALTFGALTVLASPAAAVDEVLPGDGNWSANFGATSPVHLWDSTAIDLADGRLFVVGQRLTPPAGPFDNFADAGNAAYFDPATDTFQRVADPSRARVGQVVQVADGRIAAFGGAGWGATQPGCPGGVGEVYSPATNQWASIPAVAGMDCRASVSAARMPDGTVLLWARVTAVWDPTTNTTAVVPGQQFIDVPNLVAANGKVYAAAQISGGTVASVFDPATLTWTHNETGMDQHTSKGENLYKISDEQLFFASDSQAWLIDTDTLVATQTDLRRGNSGGCAAGVLTTGVPIMLSCFGSSDPGESSGQVYDADKGAWRGIPNDRPDLRGNYLHSVTVPSGMYLFGLNATFDTFLFYRYVAGPIDPATVSGPIARPSAPLAAPTLYPPASCCAPGTHLDFWVDDVDDGGYYVTSYRVTRSGDGPDEVVDVPVEPGDRGSVAVSVPQYGSATYTVQALNPLGAGPVATYIATETPRAPQGVTGLSATAIGDVVLNWTAPSDWGSSPSEGYLISRRALDDVGDIETFSVVGVAPTYTDTAVEVGVSYDYYVQARNQQGLTSDLYGIEGRDFVTVTVEPAPNTAPVATDAARSVRGDHASPIELSAFDADDDPLTFEVSAGPSHGTLSGTAPSLVYSPVPGYTGPDALTYVVTDGQGGTDTATLTLTVTDPVTGTSGVSQVAAAGQTVTTGGSPTPDEPTIVGVSTPVAGTVTITDDPSVADPSGYAIVGSQYRIEAPDASVAEPLRVTFGLAASELPPGEDENSLVVFRNGTPIGACADSSGAANPDPCVAERAAAGGVVTITVLSSHASAWTLGVLKRATSTVIAPVAASSYGQSVTLVASVSQTGPLQPVGTVTFREVSSTQVTLLGTATVGADGKAILVGQVLDAGTHQITASYSGSTSSSASTSPVRTVTVAKAPVVIATSSTSGLLSVLTFRVTYTSSVRSAVTGAPVVGVPVTTRVNGGSVNTGCTAVTNASGIATCTSGPVQISIGTRFTATTPATANHLAGTGSGYTRLF